MPADTNGYAYDIFAVPGHTTQNLLQRIQKQQVREAIADADIISISIGGNNFLLGNLNALLYDAIVKEDYTRFDEIARAVLQTLFDNGLGAQTTPVIREAGRDMRGTGVFTWFVQFYGSLFRFLAVIRQFFSSVFTWKALVPGQHTILDRRM